MEHQCLDGNPSMFLNGVWAMWNWRYAWEGFCSTRNFLQQRMYKLWRWNFIYIDSTLCRFLLIERRDYVKGINLLVWTNGLFPFVAYYYIMLPLSVTWNRAAADVLGSCPVSEWDSCIDSSVILILLKWYSRCGKYLVDRLYLKTSFKRECRQLQECFSEW